MGIKASTAVKRLAKEILQLEREKNAEPDAFRDYAAAPLEDNLFEWHFTVRGPRGTEFEGGKYHGKIILPQEYPFKPPSIILLTPNGRFSLNKKICLSITGFHPEYWQPAWDIRSVLLAIISMFPTDGDGAVGALYHSERQRRELAKQSGAWVCAVCGSKNSAALPDPKEGQVRPSRAAAENEECQAPVQIPGISFAYERDEAAPPRSSSSSAETADEKRGAEDVLRGSGSSDHVQDGDEDGGGGGRFQATPDGGAQLQPGGRKPADGKLEAALDPDGQQFGVRRPASGSAAADELSLRSRANLARDQTGQSPAGEAAVRPHLFERRAMRQKLQSWALDLVIAVLVCVIAERLARKFYILS